MIIAMGFRAKSSIGNTFRKWANQTLKEYMIKGFAIDDERLKDSSRFGKDYKLHYAVSGETAEEISYLRANSAKDNMGLTSWKVAKLEKVMW